MSTFDHICQYYSGNIRDSEPKGILTLSRLLGGIKHPPERYKKLIKQIRNTERKGERDKLKTKLPSFTPCAFVEGRRQYEDIICFNQVAMLDFDGLPSVQYAEEFRGSIFKQYGSIYASWLSSSGKGVRAFVRIPTAEGPDEFKEYFAGIEQEFGQYKGFDGAPKNCILPLFYSIDRGLLQRNNPTVCTEKYTPPKPKRDNYVFTSDKKGKTQWVIENAKKAIRKINGNGHPQLRAAAYTVGGYVAGGYISQHEAVSLMENLIEGNGYLSQKPRTYKKTARTMIKEGQSEPLYFS